MKLRTLAPLCCAAALGLWACSNTSAGPGTGAAPADTTGTNSGDAKVGTSDTTSDAKAADATVSGDTAVADAAPAGDAATAGPNECCKTAGAQCGFVKACPTSCGGCPLGQSCKDNKCSAGAPTVKKKKFGEYCGPSKECPYPPAGSAQAVFKEYYSCVDGQCEDNQCSYEVCSKPCVVAKDVKINFSGAEGSDGVEDPDQNSECEGAADGPAGTKFKCLEIRSVAQVQQGTTLQMCIPGTSFKPCKATSDCTNGEVCGYRYFFGTYRLVCAPKYKSPAKPGATYSETCNEDQKNGDVVFCANNLCFGNGQCAEFCKDNKDCVLAGVKCTAGKCANGKSCIVDFDCSAFECNTKANVFGKDYPPAGLCTGKVCGLDKDCPDDSFCRLYINGVKDEDGDPDPVDPKSVIKPGWAPSCQKKGKPPTSKKGDLCDDFTTDADTTIPPCENPQMCMDGYCGGLCKTNADCPNTMKCGVIEFPIDTSEPADKIYDYVLAQQVCLPAPGAAGPCLSSKQCTDKTANTCIVTEIAIELPGDATGTTKKVYTTDGNCIVPNAKFKGPGEECGAAVAGTCNSGVCLGTQSGSQPGYCVEPCTQKSDCPAEMKVGGKSYKSICRGLLMGWGGKYHDPNKFVYAPFCAPSSTENSLADCSKDKKCASKDEVCFPFVIAWGPDKAAKVEYGCGLAVAAGQAKPTKKIGEACNPTPADNAPAECAFSCSPDVEKGKGYCTDLCSSNADCGSNDNMYCDLEHQWISRDDVKKAGIVPICKKKKACLPCDWHNDCAG
ncbi:MAG: hypothetical protein EXR79_14560, partial [Myxococcales bacterium]|nr:hypothetical protein [Myxococcales bacterium]